MTDYFEMITQMTRNHIARNETRCTRCGAKVTPQEVDNGTVTSVGQIYDDEADRFVPLLKYMHTECESGAV